MKLNPILLLGALALILLLITHPWDLSSSYLEANVLLITIDCLRADHVGLYGYGRNTTPYLDELGKSSAVFLNAYTHSPWTLPSLASIHTGMHPRDHGVTQWNHILDDDYTTLAEVLNAHGYYTEAYVSHILFRPKYGYTQGFDHYDYSILDMGYPRSLSSSRELTDKVLSRLDDTKQPFFIWTHYFDPHFRYLPHKGFNFGRGRIDRYDGEIAYTDYHIKRLLDGLKDKGLLEKTIIVVVSDHGEEFQDHGGEFHTDTLYQELVHIPLIVRVPGFGHQIVNEVVVESDIAATLIKLVGLPIPEDFHGNPIPFNKDGFKPKNKTVYAETRRKSNVTSILEGDYKLIIDHVDNSWELYNLQEDPHETHDLVSQEIGKAMELEKKLLDFYRNLSEEAETFELSQDTIEKLEDLGYLT